MLLITSRVPYSIPSMVVCFNDCELTIFPRSNVYHCKSIFSTPFYVYTAKKFPGMEGSLLSPS